jgi:hypothetical protein
MDPGVRRVEDGSFDLEVLAVGEPIPQGWKSLMGSSDGARLEQPYPDSIPLIIVTMQDVSGKEAEILRQGAIEARIFRERRYLMAVIRFGGTPLMFDLFHDPTLYPAHEWPARLQGWEKGNLVGIVAVDTGSGLVVANRLANLPRGLWLALLVTFREAYEATDNYSSRFRLWMDGVWARYGIRELWRNSAPAGTFGEHYLEPPNR